MKKRLPFIIGFIIIAIIIGIIILKSPKKTEIPNCVGMTVEQVKEYADKAKWKLVVRDSKGRDVEDNQSIVISQNWNAGDTLGEDSIFVVYVKESEDLENIENTIKEFAEITRTSNNGSVKYDSYTRYKTTKNGKVIYKIRYTTSSNVMLYYQLISLNSSTTTIDKYSRLFSYSRYPDGHEEGESLELEYAYEQLWEN